MRIHTKLVYEYENGAYVLVHEEGFEYTGPVALCKGDKIAKEQEQQQLDFNKQLESIFTAQFAQQQQTLSYLKGKLQPMIDNPTGYSDEALAAMRTSATDTTSTAYQNSQKAMQNSQVLRSGDLAGNSGVNAQLSSELLNEEAATKAGAQQNITLQNENLKQQNYWNALNVLNGQSANQMNPLGYSTAYNQGSGDVAGLSRAVTASNGPSFGSILGGVAGGVIAQNPHNIFG